MSAESQEDIDMEGLEDDPDFWDMNIEEKVEDVYVRDLTKPKVQDKDEESQPFDTGNAGKLLNKLDRVKVESKKLPNGNFE
ncbi:hypothetical protein H0H81_005658 [Sphagnurus paluster]|uniref:Uncharacterized protein n=1 Tax=Sphagnurus paluster TaxID=117069 RepID=A0A9P7FU67_9AGAR|nr:hypothetical protein H0H81_005658 [Sphagnurus paluster]